MAVIFGAILVLAGFACGIVYAVWLSRANAEVLIPLLRTARTQPRASTWLNIGAVALVIWGANLMTAEVGPWAFVLLGGAVLVPFNLVRFWHNRRVTAGAQR
jgi:Flp pilus assembly protein TadB